MKIMKKKRQYISLTVALSKLGLAFLTGVQNCLLFSFHFLGESSGCLTCSNEVCTRYFQMLTLELAPGPRLHPKCDISET